MRVEEHGVGSILHVVKRGARGAEIVRDENDCQRFLKSIYYLNEEYRDDQWLQNTAASLLVRPSHWPERKPLVSILAWTLMPNHFHFLLLETREKGMAEFMQRLCGSMTLCFNAKYEEQGSIFQGGYKGKLVDRDSHLKHLVFYILVKNVLELYPGGLQLALKNFDEAWNWALAYEYSSLHSCVTGAHCVILDEIAIQEFNLLPIIHKVSPTYLESFKHESREMLEYYIQTRRESDFPSSLLEP